MAMQPGLHVGWLREGGSALDEDCVGKSPDFSSDHRSADAPNDGSCWMKLLLDEARPASEHAY